MNISSVKRFRLLVALCLSAFILGCAGSGVNIVKIRSSKYTGVIVVMPDTLAEKRFSTSDWSRRGVVSTVIGRTTGIYTYTFGDDDYKNLRTSLVESLRSSGAFQNVVDQVDERSLPDGVRLYIKFSESGMNKTALGMSFICILKAIAWTEDSNSNVLNKKDISINEESIMTVSAAKNQAIEKFVLEVASIL
jgi:hypothetical protein